MRVVLYSKSMPERTKVKVRPNLEFRVVDDAPFLASELMAVPWGSATVIVKYVHELMIRNPRSR